MNSERVFESAWNAPLSELVIANAFCCSTPRIIMQRCTDSTTTATPSSTPSNMLVPDGGACASPAECASHQCIDGICQPLPNPVPVTSTKGLVLAVAILAGLAALTLRRRAA